MVCAGIALLVAPSCTMEHNTGKLVVMLVVSWHPMEEISLTLQHFQSLFIYFAKSQWRWQTENDCYVVKLIV